MEEQTGAQMDSGVSSTTEDGQEAPERPAVQEPQVTGSHRDVHTVITVESVQEEDMIAQRNKPPITPAKTPLELKTPDKKDPIKISPKLPLNQDLSIKKIVIKCPFGKDIHIQKPLQKPLVKPDETRKIIDKIVLANKAAQPSVSTKPENAVDTSKKIEIQTSPKKDIEINTQNSSISSSVVQKPEQKSPVKESSPQVSLPAKAVPKASPSKEQQSPSKEVQSPSKEPQIPSKQTQPSLKQQVVTSPAKAEPVKTATVNELRPKISPIKNTPKVFPIKDTPKVFPIKDTSKVIPIKDTPKVFPIKDTSKVIPIKDTPKVFPIKDTPKVFPIKDMPKVSPIKDTPKVFPIKDTPKVSPIKDAPNNETPVKESLLKPTIVKHIQANTINIKEQPSKTTPGKEPPPKPITETIEEKLAETNNKSEADKKVNKIVLTMEDKELSNDSQVETGSDISEKEHNRSLSRELRSLINSAKESKIISECNQVTSKTRKSRTPLDTSSTCSTVSADAEKIQGVRRGSDNSQLSTSSETSEKISTKRSMRSQNPEFVTKVKNFMNSVSAKFQKSDELSDDEPEERIKQKEIEKEATPTAPKKKKMEEIVTDPTNKLRSDAYCWRCHWAVDPIANEKNVTHPPLHCSVCPRGFHFKCLTTVERTKINTEKAWVCPECQLILLAESSETRSPAMKKISLGMLCDLLKHALDRMLEVNGVEPFTTPVDRTSFPDYDKYVVHPMDLGRMRDLINDGQYGSTEAFLADAQWILHNSIIFNTLQAKLTGGARALVRSCRAEMSEIEACPECYAAAHARRPTWFTDVCSTPHILLWAKLKGFPYWPAKGMSVNSAGLVDVRFFGAHDRAWVPARDCFLYCEKDPNNFRTKRQDILDSMQEAEQHIRTISRKYGKFVYPAFKTPFDPAKLYEQIKLLIPSFEGEVRTPLKDKSTNSSPNLVKDKSRSNSKSSKGSFNDGYMSEGDEVAVRSRKMADGAEIAREEEDNAMDKDKTIEVEVPQMKDAESRKRRRSDLEEAVITIIDNKEKRKRVESVDKTEDKNDSKESIEKKTNDKESQEPKDQKPKDASNRDSPSTSTGEKKIIKTNSQVRVISISKVMKQAKVSPKVTPKEEEKTPNPKQKAKLEKSNSTDKEKSTPKEEKRALKRRNSKNKSLNNSNVKTDKSTEKKEKSDDGNKEKAKDSTGNTDKVATSTPNAKSSKERIQFDDNTSLAVLAREVKNTPTGLPTISSVRSLSVPQSSNEKPLETTVEATSDSNIFTPTSTENVKNMKDAVNKLQKLRGENDAPQVGRVGVRAFARMTSPPENEVRQNDVQVEIKAEPMDFEESERVYQEKMDLMNAFKLRPVNPAANNLRDVRINKVVVTPVARKAPAQPAATRAKKTFPQPKKADEGRSELTSKNSMVYIPIQPPTTQAPVRPARPGAITVAALPQPLPVMPHSTNTSLSNSTVNTMTPPLVAGAIGTLSSPSTTNALATYTSTPGVGTVGPTVGQVPTTVHTMPLITSVNGQWTFSLQPVLSVGGVDGAASPPMVNGMSERPTALVPIAPAPAALAPAAPALASRTGGDTHLGEPPRLQQRPSLIHPLDANAPLGHLPPPSSVGPLTAKLNQNSVKLTDFFRTLLEESLEKLDEPQAQMTATKLRLEQLQWRHHQEINEIRHNHELVIAEMRSSFEKDKARLVADTRRQMQVELDAAVKHAKSKQWCANCNQEAQFYCCWNTSYCDYPCQRAHWTQHYAVCTQSRPQDHNNSDNTNTPDRLPPPPETLTKTSQAPALTVGGKLAPSRVYTQEQLPQKSSIILSMVEDGTGNQTMKCLGTYKAPSAPPQMSPLILNKQIMTSEEAAKKVVTSGGYLIVGATNSAPNTTTITTARRATALQYIS